MLCMFLSLDLLAQQSYVFPATVEKRIRLIDGDPEAIGAGKAVNPGELIHLVGTSTNLRRGYYRALWNDVTYWIDLKELDKLNFETERLTRDELWHLEFIKSEAYNDIAKFGWSYDIRTELEQEYESFYQTLERYDDPLLADYLNQALLKVAPLEIAYQHPALLRVHLFESPLPSSYSSVNGDIYLSTGLLATLHTESELYSFLASEVAHVYFDHSVTNYRNIQRSLNRAAFWSSLITTAAAAAEIAAISRSEGYYSYAYYPGAFTENVGYLSSAIAYSIASRLGMAYTLDQRKAVDKAVDEVLRNQAVNPQSLAIAMKRIYSHSRLRRDFMLKGRVEFYPDMLIRFKDVTTIPDEELDKYEPDYVRRTALMRNAVAWQAFHGRDYKIAQKHIDLQFRTGVAMLDDYLLQSVLLRQLSTSQQDMELALDFLSKAEQRDFSLSGEFYLEKALVLLRLSRKAEAVQSLQAYQEAIRDRQGDKDAHRQWWVFQTLEQLQRELAE